MAGFVNSRSNATSFWCVDNKIGRHIIVMKLYAWLRPLPSPYESLSNVKTLDLINVLLLGPHTTAMRARRGREAHFVLYDYVIALCTHRRAPTVRCCHQAQ